MKIAILGGGLTGLAAGEILSKEHKITIYEKSSELGGLAGSFKVNNIQIPKYYHHVIDHNKTTIKYLKKYKLFGNPKWKKIKVAIAVNKEIREINNLFDLFKFKYLTFYEKIRFGLFGAYCIFLMNPKKIPENLDAKTWLNKYAGKQITKKIWYHLYARNKFNTSLSKISAKQLANRIHEKEVYAKFTYPKHPLQSLIDEFEKTIIKNKSKIIKESKIKKIDLKNKKIDNKKYDLIINTIPIPEFLKLQTGLQKKEKERLSKLKYCPLVCVTFGTKKILNNKFYWTNFFKERYQVLMQHSILTDRYPWKINWLLRYGGSEEDLNKKDFEIKKLYLEHLKKYFPKMKVSWFVIFKEKYGEPIYDINYMKYKPNYITSIKHLYHAGIQVTYPKIRNMNTALESGIKVANIINSQIKQRIL